MNYLTGANGFVGNALLDKIDAIHIPHQKIDTFKLKDFDKLLFCSAYGNMSDHTDDDMMIKANLLDLVSLLTQAVKLKFNSFVYISTSSVTLPVQTMYSRTKKAGEEICMAYMEKYNLPITIIRPYTICGKWDNPKHLIPTLINSSLENSYINLCEGTHDFIDVEDVVNGILNLSDNQAKGIYELGNGYKVTNEDVALIVEAVTKNKLYINHVEPLRKYDNPNWVCTDFKAHSFGWKPTKSLKKSVEETYEQIKRDS